MNKFILCAMLGTLMSPAIVETLTSPAMSMQNNVDQEIQQVNELLNFLTESAIGYEGHQLFVGSHGVSVIVSSINVDAANYSVRVNVRCEINGQHVTMDQIYNTIAQHRGQSDAKKVISNIMKQIRLFEEQIIPSEKQRKLLHYCAVIM